MASSKQVRPVRTALSLAIILLAVSLICAQETSPNVPAQTPRMPGYPAVDEPPIVTVLSEGSAPRKELRYVVAENHRTRIEATLNKTMTGASGVGSGTSKKKDTFPPLKLAADLAVTGIAANGDITYDLAFTSVTLEDRPGIDPMVARGLKPLANMASSMKGGATVSSRGITRSTRLEAPNPAVRTMLGELITAMRELTIPLPDAAVGVGAKWEVRQALAIDGLSVFSPIGFQRTEYEVVSLDGPTVSLKIKSEQTAPPQSLHNPLQPISNQGITFGGDNSLQKLSGSSKGTAAVRLDTLVSAGARESRASMEMMMSMTAQTRSLGQPASLTVDVEARIAIAPARKPAGRNSLGPN